MSPIDLLKAGDESDSMPDYIPKGEFAESPKIKKKRHDYLQSANNIRQTALSASPRFRSPYFGETEECVTRKTKRNLGFTPN